MSNKVKAPIKGLLLTLKSFDARESIPKGMDWMKEQRPEM